MTEYVNIRASETLGQDELVRFLKARFPDAVKPVGRTVVQGTECVEVRVPSASSEFEDIRRFVDSKRTAGAPAFTDFSIGWYLRKYARTELDRAEILRLKITSHFEPAGEECGTIYQTICEHCNLGIQLSDLALDLRRAPQNRDIAETIARVEWIVSQKFVQAFEEKSFTGAEFGPVLDCRNPMKRSHEWHQLRVTGKAGRLANATKLGRDPFSPSQINWRCPLGHSIAAQLLSEVYLSRDEWDGSDVTVTENLFGQGRNLLRPPPVIVISQRLYRMLRDERLSGFSVEIAHFA
jgi:hypothetical protein